MRTPPLWLISTGSVKANEFRCGRIWLLQAGKIAGMRIPVSQLLFVLASFGVNARGAVPVPAADTLVHATLLADSNNPGQPFTLGILLEIKPGWHIYWVNPGDSGRATRVTIAAPKGYSVGPVQFPVPTRIVQPGDEVVFGYTGSVMLLAEIHPPAQAEAGSGGAPFTAHVSYLCCEKLCMPGKIECQLDWSAPAGDQSALFKQWKSRLPISLGAPEAPATGSVTSTPDGQRLDFSIELNWGATPAEVQFFPDAENALKISSLNIATNKATTHIHFVAEALKGEKLTRDKMTAVIAERTTDGTWRGVQVECPLAPLK